MKLTKRRAELVPKVLAACQDLIAAGELPTGPKLRVLCPGHRQTVLTEIRDYLIEETGQISIVELWPAWTDDLGVGLGPAAVRWPAWTDRYRWGTGARNRNWPARPKRRDARRSAVEVMP